MFAFFETWYLAFLQVLSLMVTATGSAISSVGAVLHILFVRAATRYDIKYALTDEEQSKSRFNPNRKTTPVVVYAANHLVN